MKKSTQNHGKTSTGLQSTMYKVVTRGLLLLIVLIGLVRFVINFVFPNPKWAAPVVSHQLVPGNNDVQELWAREDLYATYDDQSLLAAGNGKVYLLGSDNQYRRMAIIALDAKSGETQWSMDYSGTSILLTSSYLYLGGIGEVIALDPSTGNPVWKTSLPLSNSVSLIYMFENALYIDTSGARYHVINPQTGEIIETVNYGRNDVMPLWRDFIYAAPESLLVNEVLERIGEQRMSNVVKTEMDLYVLTLNGNLLQIDPFTRNETTLATFVPNPFLGQNSSGNPFFYYLAVDEAANLIFTYLGDSGQLFALRLSEN